MESFEDLSETIGLLNQKRKVTLKEWINWIQYRQMENGLTKDEKSAVRIQSHRKYLFPILNLGA